MGRLIGLAVALTHLVEAEGRSARRGATRVATRAVMLVIFGVVFLIGLVFALIGCYLALEPETGPAWAALITGGGTMVLAGMASWLSAARTK